MPFKPLPIGSSTNLDIDDTTANDGTAVSYINFYVDRGGAIRTIPGLIEYAALGTNAPVWAHYSSLFGLVVVVSAGRVWIQREQNGALTEVGTVAPDHVEIDAAVRPTFTEDRSNIYFAANSTIHQLNPLTGAIYKLDRFTTPQNVTSLAYIGGYLKAKGETGGGGSVPGDTHYSDDRENNYAAWEVYNNESKPDALQAIVVAYEQVYNIGTKSLEVTYIDGTVPFSVNKNAAQHFGTMAPYSVAFDDESIFYLSEVTKSRKIIEIKGGGSPKIISMPVDIPLEKFERVDDANGYLMAFRGQNFYCLDFPSANADIDGQFWSGITLAYHLQRGTWLILAKWNAGQGEYTSYRGKSFAYVENWGLRLVGGDDGKLYTMTENESVDYTVEPVLLHTWRNDNSSQWANPRSISLGAVGVTKPPPDQYQGGQYRNRQHRFIYSDMTDGGNVFRAQITSGHVTHGRDVTKRCVFYRYSVKRGSNDFVINEINEQFDYLRR